MTYLVNWICGSQVRLYLIVYLTTGVSHVVHRFSFYTYTRNTVASPIRNRSSCSLRGRGGFACRMWTCRSRSPPCASACPLAWRRTVQARKTKRRPNSEHLLYGFREVKSMSSTPCVLHNQSTTNPCSSDPKPNVPLPVRPSKSHAHLSLPDVPTSLHSGPVERTAWRSLLYILRAQTQVCCVLTKRELTRRSSAPRSSCARRRSCTTARAPTRVGTSERQTY